MKKKIYIALVFLGVVILIFFGYKILRKDIEIKDVIYKVQPRDQPTRVRNFVDYPIKLEGRISDKQGVYSPVDVHEDEQHNIYVFDSSGNTSSIIRFDRNFNNRMEYDIDFGQGPKEVSNIIDYNIFDGLLYISDHIGRNIATYDSTGKFVYKFKTQVAPYRFSKINDDFVVTPINNLEKFIYLYSNTGLFLRSFGEIINEQEKNSMTLDSYLRTSEKGDIIAIGNRSGIMTNYSANGNLNYIVKSINYDGFPKLIRTATSISFDPKVKFKAWQINIIRDKIYISSKLKNGKISLPVIDIYNLNDGTYLHSFKIPSEEVDGDTKQYVAWCSEKYIYTLSPTNVYKWSYKAEW
jgi:hypothetical protein